MPSGGMVGLLPSQEVVLDLLGGLGGPMPGGHLLPCLRVLFGLLA